ncbi:MAG TPA: GNAT family N-acetyltransferase [Chthonomonadaceae bacterium]|nr:GNAT family N-acetyltransferase [Chthonomonadaceae bacterium]
MDAEMADILPQAFDHNAIAFRSGGVIMRIREAKVEDAERLAYVSYMSRRTTYAGLLPESLLEAVTMEERIQRWNNMLQERDTSRFCYVVEEIGGEIVGFASGGPERDGDPIYRGELYTLYLLQEVHRQGIGRQLVMHVAQRLLDLGFEAMLVHVLATNPARGFYERLGGQFLEEGVWEAGGNSYPDITYGWPDIRVLLSSSIAALETLPPDRV